MNDCGKSGQGEVYSSVYISFCGLTPLHNCLLVHSVSISCRIIEVYLSALRISDTPRYLGFLNHIFAILAQ